ncbi:esterase [Mycobacterium sp.]|jgi:hypothetical protein|uniref:esterase n=1 Tax=Mycobacterium sp. TaxID=1785 RepID=UPI0033407575|nr:hypothetical protein [Mycobacterium sp.]
MRIVKAALSVTAVVLLGWSGTAVASAETKCTDLKGTVDITGQTCQIQASTPTYTMNISFPALYPDEKSLMDYVTQTRDGFVNVAQTPSDRGMPYELDVTTTGYSSAVPPRGTQSVVFKTFQDVGGAHPQTFYKAFNWDQGLRKPITFDTLWAKTADPLPVIFPIVQADLQKQSGLTNPILPGTGLDPSHYQNFAVTNDAVIFFFSQGELLPEAAGATQVAVPRSAIDPMIA